MTKCVKCVNINLDENKQSFAYDHFVSDKELIAELNKIFEDNLFEYLDIVSIKIEECINKFFINKLNRRECVDIDFLINLQFVLYSLSKCYIMIYDLIPQDLFVKLVEPKIVILFRDIEKFDPNIKMRLGRRTMPL